MGALEGILERLEAVATRLESQAGGAVAGVRLPAAAAAAPAAAAPEAAAAAAVPPSVAAFDAILAGPVKKVTSLAAPLGPEIVSAAALFAAAFTAERAVLAAVAACGKPDMGALQGLITPVGEAMMKVGAKAEGRVGTTTFPHVIFGSQNTYE
jgi:adenylyl cyclase-associated protein